MVSHGLVLPTRGVVLQHSGPTDLRERVRDEVVDLGRAAEDAGFTALWVGDSVLAKPRLEPFTTLAAVAGATETAALGTAVYLPTLRHPVNVAHQVASLALASGRRLHLGMGVGRGPAVEREYGNLGRPYGRRGPLLDEIHDVLDSLLAGEAVTYDGEFVSLDDASIGFAADPDPVLYVPYRTLEGRDGFPSRVADRIADHAGGWLPIAIPPETYTAGLEEARDLAGDDGFEAAYYLNVVIDESEADAIQAAREFLEAYYPRLNDLSDDEVRSQGAFGPIDRVRDVLDTYADAGVERFVIRFTAADQWTQLERYGDLVA